MIKMNKIKLSSNSNSDVTFWVTASVEKSCSTNSPTERGDLV